MPPKAWCNKEKHSTRSILNIIHKGIPIVVSIVSCAPIWPPANHFLKGLAFPRMAKVISRKVWHFRAWRKSFPEWFGVSAHGESRFPNGLELVVAKIWKLTVQRNGYVRLLGHYYNVPHTYVGKKESMRKRKTKERGKSLAM